MCCIFEYIEMTNTAVTEVRVLSTQDQVKLLLVNDIPAKYLLFILLHTYLTDHKKTRQFTHN